MESKKKQVLVVVAHPDDEVLGCGGTIAKHTFEKNHEVHVLILAEGITARDDERDLSKRKDDLLNLKIASEKATEILGVSSLSLLKYPDNRMDSIERLDIIKTIETYIDKIKPEIVYTHHPSDLNIDHRITSDAVVTACRPYPGQFVKQILFFEVLSSTEWNINNSQSAFLPNWFENIIDTLDKKIEALKCYGSEIKDYPHSRSIKSVEYLAFHRGLTVGLKAAEAFVLARNISN